MEKWLHKWEASWQTGSYKFRFVIPSWLERGTINSHIYRTYADRHKSLSIPMLLIWMTLICIWFQKLSVMMIEICSYKLYKSCCTQVKELEKLWTAICSWKFPKKKYQLEHVYSYALEDCRDDIFPGPSISLSVKILIFNKNFGTTLGITFKFGNACSTGLYITVLRVSIK